MKLVEKVIHASNCNITAKGLYDLSLEIYYHENVELIYEELFKENRFVKTFAFLSILGLFKENKRTRKNAPFIQTLKDMKFSKEKYYELDKDEAFRRLLIITKRKDNYSLVDAIIIIEKLNFDEREGNYYHNRLLIPLVLYREWEGLRICAFFGLQIQLQNVAKLVCNDFSQEMICTSEKIMLVKNKILFEERKHLMFSNDLELSKKEVEIMLSQQINKTQELYLFAKEAEILFSERVLTALILEGYVNLK